jgi:hypothetical protein
MSTDYVETADEIEASLRKREEMFQQWASWSASGRSGPRPSRICGRR